MSTSTVLNKLGYGPLEGLPQFFSSASLSTTPVKVTLPTPTNGGTSPPLGVKVKIVNGDATNVLAWTLVKNGAAAPTITADYNATTGASVVLAGNTEIFSLYWGAAPTTPLVPWFDLYVVASAANTEVSVTWDIIY